MTDTTSPPSTGTAGLRPVHSSAPRHRVLIAARRLRRTVADRRLRALPGEVRDLGASALEWALIASVAVVIATMVGAAVYNLVQSRLTAVTECSTASPSTTCGGGTGGDGPAAPGN